MEDNDKQPSLPESAAQKIIIAARRHCFLNGFRNVTMDDLSAELGMSKKTLYSYFASKTELLIAVLAAKLDEIEAELSVLTNQEGADFEHMLSGFLSCMHRHT